MKRVLIVTTIANHIGELRSLPALLLRIERRIERDRMAVELRVRHAVHRARGAVDELAPDHVGACAVLLAALRAHARHHRGLHVLYRSPEGVHNALITAQLIGKRYRFRGVEREVVEDATFRLCARRELLICQGIDIVAELEVALLVYRS